MFDRSNLKLSHKQLSDFINHVVNNIKPFLDNKINWGALAKFRDQGKLIAAVELIQKQREEQEMLFSINKKLA